MRIKRRLALSDTRAPLTFVADDWSTHDASTVAATVFTVTSVSGTGRIYDPSQNSASQLSISKPR